MPTLDELPLWLRTTLKAGVTTASITMLREVTRKVRPPRALRVPYALGYPLGIPVAPEVQLSVLRALLSLCRRDDVPMIEAFDPDTSYRL